MTVENPCLRCNTPKEDHWTEEGDWASNYPSDSRYHEWTDKTSLVSELEALLKKYSCESVSGTPVQVLAYVMLESVKDYNEAVMRRAEWRGESLEFTPEHMTYQRAKNNIQDELEVDSDSLQVLCSLCNVRRGMHWYEGISNSRTYQINSDYTRHEFVAAKPEGAVYNRYNLDDIERQLAIGKPICKYDGYPEDSHENIDSHTFEAM